MPETKICRDCGIEKPLEDFPVGSKKYGTRRAYCRPCHKIRYYTSRASKESSAPSVDLTALRTCKNCGETRTLAEFPYRRRYGIDYHSHLCRDCYAAKRRAERIAKSGWTPPQDPFIDPATGIEMKKCIRCGTDRPLTEFGTVHGKKRGACKHCLYAEHKAYYWANPDPHRQKAREWAEQNQERVRANKERWYTENRERMLLHYRKRNQERKGQQREYDRVRRSRPGFWKEQYYKNPDSYKATQKRRRARKANAPAVEFIDRRTIIERDNSTCYLCGSLIAENEVTLDHVVPLNRGGSHTHDNLRVACRPCNSRKKDHLLEELDWYNG